jgi:hypothetical protein
MNAKKQTPGDVVTQTSVDVLLRTVGISLARWAHELLYTDAAYAEQYLEQISEQMATLSVLCHHFVKLHKEVPRDVMVDLPEDVTGFVVVNPLARHSMDEVTPNDATSSHGAEGLFPF